MTNRVTNRGGKMFKKRKKRLVAFEITIETSIPVADADKMAKHCNKPFHVEVSTMSDKELCMLIRQGKFKRKYHGLSYRQKLELGFQTRTVYEEEL